MISVGINYLPIQASDGLAELLGPVPALLEERLQQHAYGNHADRLAINSDAALPRYGAAEVIQNKSGYTNQFDKMAATMQWCPAATLKSPCARTLSVTSDVNKLYCAKLGHVRIRFQYRGDVLTRLLIDEAMVLRFAHDVTRAHRVARAPWRSDCPRLLPPPAAPRRPSPTAALPDRPRQGASRDRRTATIFIAYLHR